MSRADPALAGVRVALDARYAARPGMGIHTYLQQVVRLLTDAGADLTLLVNFPAPEPAPAGFEGLRWESFGSATHLLWEQRDLPRRLRRGSFDLYWAPANTGVPFAPVGATKQVLTIHDLIPLRLPREHLWGQPLFAGPYLLATASSVLRSDLIFTVSASSAADLRRLFRRRSTVAASMLYGDALPAATPDDALPAALAGQRYVLYNGGRAARKGVDELLGGFALATREIPDLRLVLMGGGYEQYAPRLAALGIEDRTILTGFVSEEDKFRILRGAAALAYPSRYEGFGLPLLEAFSQDVPVVTARNSSLTEVACDAAVYVDPRDPASIAAGLVEAQRPDVAQRLRALGRERLRAYEPGAIRATVIDALVGLLA